MNTIVGFGIIVLLMFLGVDAVQSNVIGYTLGGLISYYLNSKYTFHNRQRTLKQAVIFFMILLISYGLNLIVLQYFLVFLNQYIAQIFAAFIYTLSAFILARILVFKKS